MPTELSLDGEGRRRIADFVYFLTGSGVPTDGISGTGAGYAGPSSLYFDITNSLVYINEGIITTPTWVLLGISNLGADSITTVMLQALSVTTAKIANLAVTQAKIDNSAVGPNQLAALAVETAKIALLAVDTAQLADVSVTTAKVALLAITSGLLAADSVTASKTASSVFKQFTGTISSADITDTGVGKFGHANGYPIIPGQGAHNIIELISVLFFYDFSTAAYTAGGNITANRSAGAGALSGLISAANSVGAAVDKAVSLLPLTTAGINLTENEGVNLVSSAAFTQPGTAAGVIRYVANCRIHATGF